MRCRLSYLTSRTTRQLLKPYSSVNGQCSIFYLNGSSSSLWMRASLESPSGFSGRWKTEEEFSGAKRDSSAACEIEMERFE